MKIWIDKLAQEGGLSRKEWTEFIENRSQADHEYLFEKARAVRERIYGRDIYLRGLIEFSSYCKNDCFYCGLRASNRFAQRYRLTKDEVLECCKTGYELDFRTFVLQSGEDPYFTDAAMVDIISTIRANYPDCAITLSMGEKSRESYQKLFDAGADRYLLRHETANPQHYEKLHPPSLSLENRIRCLHDLIETGYQVGAGFMVGSPEQTTQCLVDDMLFLKEINPQMVGIGPFIPHKNTPFGGQPQGTLELTLFMLACLRLMLPNTLLPATTALGTICANGRELGIMAGANIIMPNLSPKKVREKYLPYDGKISTGDEAAESYQRIRKKMENIGYNVAVSRGDCAGFEMTKSFTRFSTPVSIP